MNKQTSKRERKPRSRRESKPRSKLTLWTIGHSTHRLKEFVALLKHYGIKQLVDVRRWPASRKVPWFNKERLTRSLPRAGVAYFWLGEQLGGFRKGGYGHYTQTQAFSRGIAQLMKIVRKAPTAIMCAEAVPWRCHRRFIAQALQQQCCKIVHIIDKEKTWPK